MNLRKMICEKLGLKKEWNVVMLRVSVRWKDVYIIKLKAYKVLPISPKPARRRHSWRD